MSKDVRAPAWEAHFWVAGAQDPWRARMKMEMELERQAEIRM